MDWFQIKLFLTEASGVSRDALHAHIGLSVMLAAALALRRPLGDPVPWLAALVVAAANEWYDLSYELWPERELQWQAAWHDLVNTMVQPTLLLAAARFLPPLRGGRTTVATEGDGTTGSIEGPGETPPH